MSRAIALVRFNDGTILRGCYNGTSDFLSQWLITDEELEEEFQRRFGQFLPKNAQDNRD